MRPLSCLLGRHRWEHRTNPDTGGRVAVYDQCTRCGKERDSYDPPPPGSLAP